MITIKTDLLLAVSRWALDDHQTLALGGGAMQEDAEPRDAAARQRICDAINVRRDQP